MFCSYFIFCQQYNLPVPGVRVARKIDQIPYKPLLQHGGPACYTCTHVAGFTLSSVAGGHSNYIHVQREWYIKVYGYLTAGADQQIK